MPKNTKTASAESNFPISSSDLNALASAANYSDFYSFATALGKGTVFKASDFGSSVTVAFGRYSWFPVYAAKVGDDITLTLFLDNADTAITFSDGTTSENSAAIQPNCNIYAYSWIRAAINAGQTAEGTYFGSWGGMNSSKQPTEYSNGYKSDAAICAPVDFNNFADFVGAGTYSNYIVAGPTGDNVWLPSLEEAQVGNGSWGLTADYFGSHNGSSTYTWTRSYNSGGYRSAYALNSSGASASSNVTYVYGVRPAITVKMPVLVKPDKDTTLFIYSGTELTYSPVGFNEEAMEIDGNKAIDAGNYPVKVTPKGGYSWTDGTTTAVEFTFTINKATPSVLPVFGSGRPFVTSGFPEPDSYTAGFGGIQITGTFSWPNQAQKIEAGVSKTYDWLFTPDDEFIDNFTTVDGTATFNFQERTVKDMEPIFNSNGKTVYTKTSKDELMDMITLKVTYNDGEVVNETNFDINYSLHEGTGNTITVLFGSWTPKIVDVDDYVVLAEVESVTVVYNQGSDKITPLNNINDLKQYLTVYPKWNYTNTSEPLGDEDYSLEGELTVGSPEIYVVYEGIKEVIKPTPTVTKATYDTSNLKFEDKLAAYKEGVAFDTTGWATGLPEGVTVSYTCDTDLTAIGTHTVTAHFEGDYDVYEQIKDMTATLTIEDNYVLPEILNDTLFYNPDGNKFEISNFEGVKDIVKLTLNGQTVTDINAVLTQTEIADYTLEITLTEGKFLGGSSSVTLTFSIVKRVVEMPAYIVGSMVYSGKTLTPTAENFEYDSVGCFFVRAESGLNAGSYYAVFALFDTEHYEWANGGTKSAVKLTLTDEEELAEGEMQVPWTIAKATVSAVAEDGKMPVFTCATVGDLSKYITYTYYKDELCTESVAFADLQPDTRYYVKATFTDEDENFELDDSALGVIGSTITYDTPAAEPNFFQKAFAYVKEHWLWFAIGAAVLLFLIILIIIIAATRKKRKEKAEERKAEKKEEERQRRAEEREERMMRMQGMGGMPMTAAGMIAAQQAQAQPAAQSAAQQDSNAQLLAEMRAQMAELRAENKAAQAQMQAQTVKQPIQQQMQQPMPVQAQQIQPVQSMPPMPYGQTDNTALLMAKLEAEFARQAQQRSEKELADSKLQSEFDKLRAELHASGRLPVSGEIPVAANEQNGDIEMIGMLAAAIWRNIKNNGAAATAEKLAGQIQNAQPTEAEPNGSYPNNAIITTTTTVDTTQKPTRKAERDKRVKSGSDFTDVDGFYDNADF